MDIDRSPAELVAILRERAGLTTQKEIAAALGVSQPTVSAWVNGTHDMSGGVRAHIALLLDLADQRAAAAPTYTPTAAPSAKP